MVIQRSAWSQQKIQRGRGLFTGPKQPPSNNRLQAPRLKSAYTNACPSWDGEHFKKNCDSRWHLMMISKCVQRKIKRSRYNRDQLKVACHQCHAAVSESQENRRWPDCVCMHLFWWNTIWNDLSPCPFFLILNDTFSWPPKVFVQLYLIGLSEPVKTVKVPVERTCEELITICYLFFSVLDAARYISFFFKDQPKMRINPVDAAPQRASNVWI